MPAVRRRQLVFCWRLPNELVVKPGPDSLALPVYLVAGWRLGGWLLAATLWLGSQAFAYFLVRLRARGNLVAAGVAAFGMMFRAIAVMIVVFAVAVSDPWLGLAAAITYALAYTVELGLSLVTYFGSPPV